MKRGTMQFLTVLCLGIAVILLGIDVFMQDSNWDTQISINKMVIKHLEALKSENAGQWQRISDFEVYFCNPELIKCGK